LTAAGILAHSEPMSLSDSWTARPAAINRQNAAEAVFEDLRGAIESGELSLGTRLPSEAALAERYGVSRPIVREALRSAQTLGLTQTRTGSGTFVIATAPSPEITYGAYSARDLMEARPVIEVPAAGWAARRRTDEQLRVLTELCAEMKREKDPDKWVSLDSRFHCVIAEASDNAVFIKVVLDARDALATQSQLINLVAHRRPASNREHQRIVDAIASGSFEDSQEAMRDHLARVARAMSKISKPDS
jgi:DNA-binding FadR family transcriptional regulator